MSWKAEFHGGDYLCEDSEDSEKLVLYCEKDSPSERMQAYVYSIITLPPTQPLDASYFGNIAVCECHGKYCLPCRIPANMFMIFKHSFCYFCLGYFFVCFIFN